MGKKTVMIDPAGRAKFHNGVDFVTRHHYTTEFPDYVGHYGYAKLMDPENKEDGFAGLHSTREIIDSFPEYKGLPIHITEFNTSYIPNCPLHDTNQNAAYIAHQLSRLGDDNESYSYWTFGDIFEENGVPFTPFHGGFGLVANGCIPKPTFWTFAFYKQLKEKEGVCVHKDENSVILRLSDGSYRGILWNMTMGRAGKTLELALSFEAEAPEYSLLTKRVDEETTNPLKVWHDMGEPSSLTKNQKELLQMAAQPQVSSERTRSFGGKVSHTFTMSEHAVIYFELTPGTVNPDRGYSYDRVMQYPGKNPLTRLDYPDVDVIRVEDTYYMVSTTMYFMPGCEILRSYDLVHWEHAAYVYDTLDSTPAQRLSGEENIYGKGMWAASLRFHKGMFYVCFVANDTGKTYLYTSKTIEGPWEKKTIEGFYHDCSLLFDDDRVYLAYGGRDVYLQEMKEDLSGPKEDGLHRLLVSDAGNPMLGYEGSHLYKINGKYYLFLIHSLREEWKRTQACFVSDSLTGEFVGGDILNDDMGFHNQGVAQGGIVDTPEGKWYSVLFQDRGSVGRIPVLVPLEWKDGLPVLGENGKIPEDFDVKSTRPEHVYTPLVGSDDFETPEFASQEEKKRCYGSFGFKSAWQFNHEPELKLVSHDEVQGIVTITTDKLCDCMTEAKNVLTQRMMYPGCVGEVTLDFSGLKEGDVAGLCTLQSHYGFIGVTIRDGKPYLIMTSREPGENNAKQEWEAVPAEGDTIRLRVEADFTDLKDEAKFSYQEKWWFKKLGITHKMQYTLDHFTGYRFGLFVYSTKETGGAAVFSDFVYKER